MRKVIFTLPFLAFGLGTNVASAQNSNLGFCNGKYDAAAKIIEDSFDDYGTLYSGGNFFSYLNSDLGGTINAYRQFQNLKPLDIPRYFVRGYDSDYESYGDKGTEKSTYERLYPALKLLTSEKNFEEGFIYDGVITLDLLTSRGPTDDWWLRAEDFDTLTNADYNYRYRQKKGVTRTQRHVAEIAKSEDALDWLQAALLLSVDSNPWRHQGKAPAADMGNLLTHIESKAREDTRFGPWMALLSHHKYYGRDVPSDLQARIDQASNEIQTCQGEPSTYASLAAANIGLSDTQLSDPLLRKRLREAAQFITAKAADGTGLDVSYYFQILSIKDRAKDSTEFALPLMLSAPDITTLKQAFEMSDTVIRPLIPLKTDDLAQINPAMAFSHYLSEDKPEKAKQLINDWPIEFPQLYAAYKDISESSLSTTSQMNLIALRMYCLSHLESRTFCLPGDPFTSSGHVHRNIGPHRGTPDFIRQELAEWLYPSRQIYNPHYSYFAQYLPQQNHRGTYKDVRVRRQYERWDDRPSANPIYAGSQHAIKRGPVPNIFSDGRSQSLIASAPLEKLSQLSDSKNLVRTLSLNIIQTVEDKAYSLAEAELLAEGLHRVVRMNKHEGGGEIGDHRLGQRAHILLQTHFKGSQWAKKTPIWWEPRRTHG